MGEILTVLGAVAVIEGLVLALAPLRYEELLRWLASLDVETRRLLGLGFALAGTLLIWLGRALSG
ncbi:MAG: DUF2065 domain-containing protein [Alphaproteobacteria bacterium]|nr:MAG: DUF2065 domain-containing protein [Alphaproteobacteria bacterium]